MSGIEFGIGIVVFLIGGTICAALEFKSKQMQMDDLEDRLNEQLKMIEELMENVQLIGESPAMVKNTFLSCPKVPQMDGKPRVGRSTGQADILTMKRRRAGAKKE